MILKYDLEFARPNNTTNYAAGKVISDSLTNSSLKLLSSSQPNGSPYYNIIQYGYYEIVSITVVKTGNTATRAIYDLFIYSSGVITQQDASQYNFEYKNKNILICKQSVTLETTGLSTNGCYCTLNNISIPFMAWSKYLYLDVVNTASYNPDANEKFYIKLMIKQI